ncbi:MAG: TRIC cation channel family protein [Acidobacteriaceae bacterium]
MIVSEQVVVNTLLVAFDFGGTFVFALSVAVAGVKNRLDLFGVLVLSFAAGNSGGIARDVMIGAFLRRRSVTDETWLAASDGGTA